MQIDTTVTHVNIPVSIVFGSPLYTGSPLQKFSSPWVEPLSLLRNVALGLSFGIVGIRYKQTTRQHGRVCH